jgi:peptidoglycan/LPS O-acetylase OafA/YrhL
MDTARAIERLHGIEAMRGIAASAVVVYHVARKLNQVQAMPSLVHATQ